MVGMPIPLSAFGFLSLKTCSYPKYMLLRKIPSRESSQRFIISSITTWGDSSPGVYNNIFIIIVLTPSAHS